MVEQKACVSFVSTLLCRGVGQGLLEGGQAAGRGLFRGLTGIVSKPVEGFQRAGFQGKHCTARACWACE